MRHNRRHRRRQPAASECLDGRAHRPARRRRVRPADRGRDLDRADAVRDAEPGVADQRRDVGRGATDECDLTVEPRHPPLVLVLHIAVRAVPHDDDRQVVAAGDEMRRDVVLARQPAVGAVAGEPPVDVHGVHAVGAPDVQHDLALTPAAGDRERPPVHTSRVAIGKPRRRSVERHLHVRVVRMVADPLQGPVAGHRQRRPARRRSTARPTHAAGTRSGCSARRNLQRPSSGRHHGDVVRSATRALAMSA